LAKINTTLKTLQVKWKNELAKSNNLNIRQKHVTKHNIKEKNRVKSMPMHKDGGIALGRVEGRKNMFYVEQ